MVLAEVAVVEDIVLDMVEKRGCEFAAKEVLIHSVQRKINRRLLANITKAARGL